MGKIISVFNQKGGVGKTTTCINLSAGLGKMGKTILLVDIDPQGNSSSGLGINKSEVQVLLYDIITEDINITEGIYTTSAENVSIIPSNNNLAGLEIELAKGGNWENTIKDTLDQIKDDYD